MTSETLILTESLEKLSQHILEELQSFLVSSSGSLMGIDSGTRIRIPTGAGYVMFYKSADSWNLNFWLCETMTEKEQILNQAMNYNVDDEK